jgi:shikimate kinase
MSVEVVCISRMLGAGGENIGRAVAERLSFRYVDAEIITAAGERARVDPTLIADAEHRQSLLDRLMDVLAVVPRARSLPAGEVAPSLGTAGSGSRAGHRAVIREAIEEIAAGGHAVIVAHAASMMLAGSRDVLRVLVTASPSQRARRLETLGELHPERRAAQAIEQSDRARRDYLHDFYNVRQELPTHYDLVINTDLLTPDQAVTAVVSVAQDA